jgi:hypothetical protein
MSREVHETECCVHIPVILFYRTFHETIYNVIKPFPARIQDYIPGGPTLSKKFPPYTFFLSTTRKAKNKNKKLKQNTKQTQKNPNPNS